MANPVFLPPGTSSQTSSGHLQTRKAELFQDTRPPHRGHESIHRYPKHEWRTHVFKELPLGHPGALNLHSLPSALKTNRRHDLGGILKNTFPTKFFLLPPLLSSSMISNERQSHALWLPSAQASWGTSALPRGAGTARRLTSPP